MVFRRERPRPSGVDSTVNVKLVVIQGLSGHRTVEDGVGADQNLIENGTLVEKTPWGKGSD